MQGLALIHALNMEPVASMAWWFGPQAVVTPEPAPGYTQPPSHPCWTRRIHSPPTCPKGQGSFPWAGQFTPNLHTSCGIEWNISTSKFFQLAQAGSKERTRRLAKQMEFMSSLKEEAVETNIVRLRSMSPGLQQAAAARGQRAS